MNGSLHSVFAFSAGGPGFDSRLRAHQSRMLYAEDVGGPGQVPTRRPLKPSILPEVSGAVVLLGGAAVVLLEHEVPRPQVTVAHCSKPDTVGST